jgi:hypothetical protein
MLRVAHIHATYAIQPFPCLGDVLELVSGKTTAGPGLRCPSGSLTLAGPGSPGHGGLVNFDTWANQRCNLELAMGRSLLAAARPP